MSKQTTDVTRELDCLVAGFIASSAFFEKWIPGAVDSQSAVRFLSRFDHLVASFPPLIALAAAHADEASRVALSENLFQECGNGDLQRTHHAIFNNYLRSIGVTPTPDNCDPYTRSWRHRLWLYILGATNPQQIVGAVAAGECLAQPALRRIHTVLLELFPNADLEYFTQHLNLETEHVAAIANLIVGLAATPPLYRCVIDGFEAALRVWADWFDALHADLFVSNLL